MEKRCGGVAAKQAYPGRAAWGVLGSAAGQACFGLPD